MKNKHAKLIIIITFLAIILLSLIIYLIISINNNEKEPLKEPTTKIEQIEKSDYSKKAISTMKKNHLYNEINNKDYSKTIEVMLENEVLKKDYLEYYYEIEYIETDEFPNIINELLSLNYNSEEINYILTNYLNNIDIILNMNYTDILKFKDISNFKIENLERYITYIETTEHDLETSITYVNIGLDKKGYTSYTTYTSEEAKNINILVNKYHRLPEDYEPKDLVSMSYNSTYKLRKEANDAFEKLTSAALLDNITIYPFSAYRSYETQNVLYTRYKERDGETEADTYSARPGFSEHQLGLAIDVRSSTLPSNLKESDYNWMENNSYKYGFIIRYPKGKQEITGFMEEPWHLRYLGKDLATKVYESKLTYDEYYDLYIEKQ